MVIIFGFLFFLMALGPYLLYAEKTNPVADRYSYIPLFGIYFIVGSILFTMFKGNKIPQKIVASVFLIVLIGSNIFASSRYSKAWKDDFRLWYHASQVEPNVSYYRTKLGLEYIRNNQFIDAEIQLSKAYELDSLQSFTLFNYGAFKHETKKYQEAVNFYSKAIEVEPLVHLIYTGRAKSYIMLGQYDEAKQDLDKSISLQHEPDAELYFYRGICKIETGDPPCTDLNIALMLGVDKALSPFAKHCR